MSHPWFFMHFQCLKAVGLKRIVHQPGSGASTIAKNVLWDLKDNYRCAVIDGNLSEKRKSPEDLAHLIMTYLWEYGEPPDVLEHRSRDAKPCPVLLLYDNAFESDVDALKDALERSFNKKDIPYLTTQIVIMYLIRDSEADLASKSSIMDTVIQQELKEVEKEPFKERLGEITDKLPPEELVNVLAFVIMANNFDKQSDYVEKVVSEALSDIEIHRTDAKLLLYLAILSVYGNSSCMILPIKQCRRLVGRCEANSSQANRPFLKTLCPEAKLFLIQVEDERFELGIRISHVIIGLYVLKRLAESKQKRLSGIVTNLLHETVIVNEPRNRREVMYMYSQYEI